MLRLLAYGLPALQERQRPRNLVEHPLKITAGEAIDDERRHAGFHHNRRPPPWRRPKRGQQSKGVSVAGITTKLHLVTTKDGHVIDGFLTGGNVHDVSVAQDAFDDIYGCYVLADKGYDSDAFRDFLRAQNNVPVIPGRDNRITKIEYDESLYEHRKNIEILFGNLKENKRIDTRFDKCDHVFLAFVALALIKITLNLIIS